MSIDSHTIAPVLRIPVAVLHCGAVGKRAAQAPDAAFVTEPNRFGPAVVWPYNDRYGNTQIRCFMPGAGT